MERKEMEKLDVTKYVGEDTKVSTAEFREMPHGKVIFLESETIPFKENDTLPNDTKLTATLILPLRESEDGSVHIGIDSKTDKFLSSKKVDISKDIPDFELGKSIESLVGLKCKAQKNERGFLSLI